MEKQYYRYQNLCFPDGKRKAVTLSYDDGMPSDIRLSDLLEKYKLKCTFNLNGEILRKDSGLKKEEVQSYILDRGHEIAVHGLAHRAEGTLRPIEGISEVLACRQELEEKFGRIIRGMAYPDSGICRFTNGASYESVKTYLKELDICYARTLGKEAADFMLPADWYAWMPTAHHNSERLMDYLTDFLALDVAAAYGVGRAPRLFYVWGHTFEFDRDKNWDKMETICERLSADAGIWFATNMEIYEYVEAYKQLVYSADGRRIYNPTLHTLWIDRDGAVHTIRSGETIWI